MILKDVSTMKYTSLMLADYCDGCKEVDILTDYALNDKGAFVITLSCVKEDMCKKLYNEMKRKENGGKSVSIEEIL